MSRLSSGLDARRSRRTNNTPAATATASGSSTDGAVMVEPGVWDNPKTKPTSVRLNNTVPVRSMCRGCVRGASTATARRVR